jgi:hypothetical protein
VPTPWRCRPAWRLLVISRRWLRLSRSSDADKCRIDVLPPSFRWR